MPNRKTMKPLLSATVAVGTLLVAANMPLDRAVAQDSQAAAAELVRQGDFWRSRGRPDLADQAYNRALQIQPNNAAARRGLAGGGSTQSAPAASAPVVTETVQSTAPARTTAAPQPSARVTTADRAGRLRVAGYAALDAGQLQSAASNFEQALAINSRDGDALGGLGLARLRQDRFAEARDLLERASQQGGASRWAEALGSARFFATLAEATERENSGNLLQAQTILLSLVQNTSDAELKTLAAVKLGDLLMVQGRFAEARGAYEQGRSADPQVAYKIATAEASEAAALGDVSRAENAYQRALASGGSSDPWLRYAFAGFLLENGRRSDGAAIIQPLETSTDTEALYAAALYYSRAERPSDTARLLARVPEAARTPQMRALDAEIRYVDSERQAKGLASAGRLAEAVGVLSRYDVPGASVGQQMRLATTYQSLGLSDRAATLARSVAQQPGLPSSQQEPLVRLLAQTDQDALALEVIQKATGGVTTTPTAMRLYSVLSVASADRLREQGQHAEAFDVLQSGWSIAPQDTAILVSLGRLYQAGGMSEEAMQVYQLALQRKANDTDALSGIADAYAARGEYGKARDAYRQALRHSPENVEIYLAAARIEQAAGDRRAARRLLEEADRLGVPKGLQQGTAFTVNNPFRSSPQRLAPVQINPFAPDTLRAAGRAEYATAALSPVQQALVDLDGDDAPRFDADILARVRSGENGLSSLSLLEASAKLSTPVSRGRAGIAVSPTVVDAGSINRSGSARFGRNATAEALAIVAQEPAVLAKVDSQYAAGVALSVYYEDENLQIDVGSTPIGFEKTDVQAGFSWRPRIGSNGALHVFGERRPVADSVLSYAGSTDPVGGEVWGAVMRTGGGFGMSWEAGGTGLYGDVAYRIYAGQGVLDNNMIEMNLGGYHRIYSGDQMKATAGISLNYQSFEENLSHFTLGHGGYFSPQNFISLAFPVDVKWENGEWSVNATMSPGYQTYQQDASLLFPNDPSAQGQLDSLKLENPDVRAIYESESRSGFAFSGGIEAWRKMGATSIGGEARMSTFGNYDEYRMMLKLRQSLGSGD